MAGVQTNMDAPEDVSGWYWAQIEELDLEKTKYGWTYRTRTGIPRCISVQPPGADWTMAVAQEQIERIKAELQKKRKYGR